MVASEWDKGIIRRWTRGSTCNFGRLYPNDTRELNDEVSRSKYPIEWEVRDIACDRLSYAIVQLLRRRPIDED